MKKKQTLYLYLFSYISFLLLGSIFIFFYQSYLISVLKEDMEKNQANVFEQMNKTINTETSQLLRMNYQLTCVNPNMVSYYFMDESPLRDQSIINELSDYVKINPIVSTIAFFKKNSDMIYTSDGILPANVFFSSMYDFGVTKPKNYVMNLSNHTVLTAKTADADYVAFIYPSSTFSNFSDSVAIFFIESSKLTNLLETSDDFNAVHLLLNSKKQSIIQSHSTDKIPQIEQMSKIILATESNNINGKLTDNYTWYLSPTDNAPLYLATFFTGESNRLPINKIQTQFFMILASFLVLGFIMVIYYMKTTYLPIKKLSTYGQNLVGEINNNNAVATIQDVIEQLSYQNEHLNHVLKNNRSMQDSLLFSLLKGKITSKEAFEQAGQYFNMHLRKRFYSVIAIRAIYSKDSSFSVSTLETLFKKFEPFDVEYYCRELFDDNQYVCVFGRNEINEENYQEIFESIIDTANTEYNTALTFAISNYYEEIKMIPTAYLEATLAIRELFLISSKHIILFKDIQHIFQDMQYPSEEMQHLRNIINNSNPQSIQNEIRSLLIRMRDNALPSIFAKHICRNITYLLVSRYHDALIDSGIDLIKIYYINSIENFNDYFDDMLFIIEKNTKEEETEEEMPVFDRILQYIDENYDNCNFSVQETANVLRINGSYMSQLFKNQMNITILDYITNLRITKAKQLLESTTMPIDMIAEEVGYYNTNSFIRRYKQITGITPGEYRKSKNSLSM